MNTVNKENTKKKKRSTFAILFYINRTKIRRDGMCQLLCRLIINLYIVLLQTVDSHLYR